MSPRLPVAAIVLSSLAIVAGYGLAFLPGGTPGWTPWLFMAGISTMVPAVILLGAGPRPAARRRLLPPLLLIQILLLAGFGFALALSPETADAPRLVLGLPLRAALILYGIGLLPAVILPVVYARTFDALTLRPEDLDRIARMKAQREVRR